MMIKWLKVIIWINALIPVVKKIKQGKVDIVNTLIIKIITNNAKMTQIVIIKTV